MLKTLFVWFGFLIKGGWNFNKIILGFIFMKRRVGITMLLVGVALIGAIGDSISERSVDPLKMEGKRYLRIDAYIYEQVNIMEENDFQLLGYDENDGFFTRVFTIGGHYWDFITSIWVYYIFFYVVWWFFNDSMFSVNTSARLTWFIMTILVMSSFQGFVNYGEVKDNKVDTVKEMVWQIFPFKGVFVLLINIPMILYPFTSALPDFSHNMDVNGT